MKNIHNIAHGAVAGTLISIALFGPMIMGFV